MAKISPSQVWLKDWENRYSLTKNISKRSAVIKDKTDKNKRNQRYVRMTLTQRKTYTYIIIKWQLKRNVKWFTGDWDRKWRTQDLSRNYHCINMISFFFFFKQNSIFKWHHDGSQLQLTEMSWLTVSGVVVDGGIGFLHIRFPPHPSKVAPKQSQLLNSIKW